MVKIKFNCLEIKKIDTKKTYEESGSTEDLLKKSVNPLLLVDDEDSITLGFVDFDLGLVFISIKAGAEERLLLSRMELR